MRHGMWRAVKRGRIGLGVCCKAERLLSMRRLHFCTIQWKRKQPSRFSRRAFRSTDADSEHFDCLEAQQKQMMRKRLAVSQALTSQLVIKKGSTGLSEAFIS